MGGSVFDQLALVQLKPGADLVGTLQRLRNQPDVLYAEPNYRLQITQRATIAPVIPDDFDFAQLWSLENVGQGDGTPGADIHAPAAWAYATGARQVVVAIIDTGIDYYHPDLADNIWTNPKEVAGNGVDDDGNGYVDDLHGYDFVSDDGDPMDDQSHGSHVSGIIGAVGNNGIGITGVCWQVSLMALKAFDDQGNGDIDTAIEAIHYAIANGARIINASWGSTDKSQALADAINEAYAAGVLFVAAAGNNNSETPFYPAAYSHVISVAATDSHDHRARFSDFGSYVAVAAPGENIFSTIPDNSYQFYSGTSMAAPHVAGVAALVLARHPEFTNDQLANILRNSVDIIPTDQYIGTGRINAAAAVRVDAPLPEVNLALPETIYGDVDIPGTAAGNGFVGYSLDYGKGSNPTNWTSFFSSDIPVPNGTLFSGFPTPQLGEGQYTFRLTARNADGEQAVERALVNVSNVHISSPQDNDILRAGEKINIMGTVFGGERTYRIDYAAGVQATNWSDAGIELAHGGNSQLQEGTLAAWDTSALAPDQFYTLRLTATDQSGSVTTYLTRLVYFDHHLRPGWPQYLPFQGEYPPEDWRNVTVADLDNDGFDEIILVDHGNSDGQPARLLVYRYDGQLLWSKDLATGYPYSDIPVVGDIDGDGLMEIFVDVGSSGQLFAFRYDGTPLPGKWPVQLEATSLGKVIADLNGDGNQELVGYSQDTVTRNGSAYRQLVVYDKSGNLLRKWEVPACDSGLDAPKMFPAVGNLDDQPDLEIVAVSACNGIAAFKMSHPSGPIWTAATFGTFAGSPVVGDLYQNGTNEIVLGAFDLQGGQRGGIYAFDGKGQVLPGWPVLLEESFTATPALADVDGDGQLEISLPSWKSGYVHLLRPDGFEVDGWPVGPVDNSSLKSSTIIGDIDGDGSPDIVLSSPGYMSLVVSGGDLSQAGGVKAWAANGQPVPLNGSGPILPLLMEASAGTWFKAAPVTLADLDHNGKLDVIAASIQDRTYLPFPEKSTRKNRSSIYVWELDVPYQKAHQPWPMFQSNPQHTGYLPAPAREDQAPIVAGIPDQIVAPGSAFFPIPLDQYVTDPDNSVYQLTWSANGNQNLSVLMLSNHVAAIEVTGAGWVGKEAIRFTAKDPQGLTGAMVVNFEVRPGYVAPVAKTDHAVTLENTPVEIDVLANDTDPNSASLAVSTYSKPLRGTLTKTIQGTLIYTPKQYAHGTDTFSYVVTDGKGGMAMGTVVVDITPVNNPPIANPDHVIIEEDTSVEIDALANDTDPDGDSISLVSFTQPKNGSVELTGKGLLRYVAKAHFYGMDSFNYGVADGHGGTNEGTVDIMIKPVNHPPIAQDQSLVLNRNSSVNITFAATDPEDTEFTFTVVDSPQHGSLWTYPKVATYYPTNGFSGSDSFTYRANDGKVDGPLATVRLTILDKNNPPDAQDQTVVTKVDQPVMIHLTATDLDDDPITYEILTQPTQGTLSGSGTNYLYQPNTGYLGSDSFRFRASDGKDPSAPALVKITVTDQNTAPVAQDFSAQTFVNTPTNITLLASDLESNPLTFHIVTRPMNGKLTGKGGVLRYSPNSNYAGPDRFSFKANDGQLDSNVGTVSIDVEAPNHAPVATNQQVVVAQNSSVQIQLNVYDPDGDPLNCPILKGPQHGRIYGVGTSFTYTPKLDYAGTDFFTYKAWDGQIYSRDAQVAITVSGSNAPTPLVFQSVSFLPEGTLQLVLASPLNKPFVVSASTNLVDWTFLPSGPATNGTLTILDPDAPKYRERYYRARLSP
jgi:subtilisin family serine protease